MFGRAAALVGIMLAGVMLAGVGGAACVVLSAPVAAAGGRVLEVGPGRMFATPSAAASQAHDDDTVLIDPGTYNDCAVWLASRLTIAARGPDVVFAGQTCMGKGIFIINGSDVTVRGITFMNASVPDHNGSGIRAQGTNLTVEQCRFIDNEEGILSGVAPRSTILVRDSEFRGNGTCLSACAHGIYAGAIALLQVENSRFTDTREGHDIKSRARRTVIRNNDISDGPGGHSSYLIDVPNGGDVLIEGNALSKGPRTDNPTTAISIGAEGARNPTASLVVRNNRFVNLLSQPTDFVHNQTQTPAELVGNHLTGQVRPLDGPGTVK